MIAFKEFLTERVLSIGFNPDHEKHREAHRQEIHDLLHKAYVPIGGYSGLKSGSKEESDSIHDDITHSAIKLTKREGKVSAVALYKMKHGRKKIAVATDGTPQGKKDYMKTELEDHEKKRAWSEKSGAPEHISKKMGVPAVDSKHAETLTGKKVKRSADGIHYTRKIGDHEHEKAIYGHPKF